MTIRPAPFSDIFIFSPPYVPYASVHCTGLKIKISSKILGLLAIGTGNKK